MLEHPGKPSVRHKMLFAFSARFSFRLRALHCLLLAHPSAPVGDIPTRRNFIGSLTQGYNFGFLKMATPQLSVLKSGWVETVY